LPTVFDIIIEIRFADSGTGSPCRLTQVTI